MRKLYLMFLLALFSWALSSPEAQAQYCASNATNSADTEINSVNLVGATTTLNNNTANICATYSDFTALTPADMYIGSTYTLTVVGGTCSGNYYGGTIVVYIDWNQDFDFTDAGETIGNQSYTGGPYTATFSVTVPAGATPGNTRMRIIVNEAGLMASCGTYSYGETEDYTVAVASPYECNLSAYSWDMPMLNSNDLTATETVKVTVKNVGTVAQSGFTVGYSIDGGLNYVTETVSTSILPGGSYQHTFATPANFLASGMYQVGFAVGLACDTMDTDNNVYIANLANASSVSTFPFFANFEGVGATLGWSTGGTNNSWEWGVPTASIINAAASPTNVWATNLDGNYNTSESSWVQSPVFNFTSLTAPIVEFKLWTNTEVGYDGVALQYTIDGGTTWQHVGMQFGTPSLDPNGENWYNASSIVGMGYTNGWQGNTNGYISAKYRLYDQTTMYTNLVGQSSVRFRMYFGSDPSGVNNGVAFDDFQVYQAPNNDIGVIGMASLGTVCAGSVPVSCQIRNFGIQTLTTATVNWMVNGVVQPSVTYTGALTANSIDTVELGNYTFLDATLYTVKAWTSSPNGVPDEIIFNDTATVSGFQTSLNGTFTVGATGYYPTIAAAVNAITQYGVCGPVVFNVESGTYTEQVTIPQILGANATNTITFQSLSGNAADVIVQHTGVSAANWVWKHNGADYITVKDMTLKSTTTTNYGRVVELGNNADYNTFEACSLITVSTTSSSATPVYIYNTGNDYNVFDGCVLQNGYYGVYNYGYSVNGNGFQIKNSQIIDYYYYGIYNYYQNNSVIENCFIKQSTTNQSTDNYPLYNAYSPSATIVGNTILETTGSTNYGLYNYYSVSNANAWCLIANNMIISNGVTSSQYGIRNYYSPYSKIYNNSIHIGGSSSTNYTVEMQGSASQGGPIQLKNNSFVNNGGGFVYYISEAVFLNGFVSSNNNLYKSTSTNPLARIVASPNVDAATLATWQLYAPTDLVSAANVYVSSTNLHSNSPLLNAAGTPLAEVPNDIDGEVRNATTPDIGCDEFVLLLNDAGVTALTGLNGVCPGLTTFGVTVQNFGLNPLYSFTVNMVINGDTLAPIVINDTIAQGFTDSYSLFSYNFLAGVSYNITAWTSLPNGLQDDNNANNAFAQANLQTSLSGTYVVGTGGDFTTIGDAVTALNNFGVCAPVIMNILPGTYNEQLSFNSIMGSSATNTITFQSSTGDRNDVRIQFPGNSSNNYVWRFNGGDYITLKDVTVKSTTDLANVYGYVVVFNNGSDFCTVDNCHIETVLTTSSYAVPVYSSSESIKLNCTIKNSTLLNGYYGAYIYGGSTTYPLNWTLLNNQILNIYYMGVYAYYADNIQIVKNNIENRPTGGYTYFYPLYMYYCDSAIKVTDNRIHTYAVQYAYGLYNNYSLSLATNPGIFANNMVSSDDCQYTAYGMYFYYSNNLKIYNNSVNVRGNSTTYALYTAGSAGASGTYDVKNNSFVARATHTSNYAWYCPSSLATYLTASYNNFHSSGTNLIYYTPTTYTSLAAFQALYPNNFVNNNGGYFSTSNLHSLSPALDGAGTPVAEVLFDIDGDARNATTPDIGADEFVLPPNDLTALGIYTLGEIPQEAGDNHVAVARVRNIGLDDQYNVTLTLNITGANTQTLTAVVDTFYAGALEMVEFPAYTLTNLGWNTLTLVCPNDDNNANNTTAVPQLATTNSMSYVDTVPVAGMGSNNDADGHIYWNKHYVNGLKSVTAIQAYITSDPNNVGNVVKAAVMDMNNNLLGYSNPDTLSASDLSTYVTFTFPDPSILNFANTYFYAGFVQTPAVSLGYAPIGYQNEIPMRPNTYYYSSNQNGAGFTAYANDRRWMIKAILEDPTPYDAMIVSMDAPTTECGLGTESLIFTMMNNGSENITSFTMSYQVQGSTSSVTETISGVTIIPGQLFQYTFTAPYNFAVTGADSVFVVNAWVTLLDDTINTNDSLVAELESKFVPNAPIPYNATVVFGNPATVSVSTPDNVLWFDNPAGGQFIAIGDTFLNTPVLFDTAYYYAMATSSSLGDFVVFNSSATYSGTQNNPYGQYYTSNTSQYVISAAQLSAMGIMAGNINSLSLNVITPTYATTAGYNLDNFSIKMGHTSLSAMTTSSWTPSSSLQTVFTAPDYPTVAGWNLHEFSNPFVWNGVDNLLIEFCFSNYYGTYSYTANAVLAGENMSYNTAVGTYTDGSFSCGVNTGTATTTFMPQMKFNATVPGCESDMVEVVAYVTNIPANDAGVIAASSPVSGAELTQETVSVTLQNLGTNAVSNFPITVEVSNGTNITEFVTQTIPSGGTINFTFNTPVDLTGFTTYDICIYTQLLNDEYGVNDTLCFQVTNQPLIYCPSNATSTAYEEIVGVGIGTAYNSSAPATGVTYTNFTANGPLTTLSAGMTYPVTVVTDLPPGYTYPSYSCYVKIFIDWNHDAIYDPVTELAWGAPTLSQNTVNGTLTVPFTALPGTHGCRVVFVETSSASGVTPCGTYTWGETEDYVISVAPPAPYDAAITAITSPSGTLTENNPMTVTINVFNVGTETISNFPVYYSINGGTPVSYTITDTLNSFQNISVSFPTASTPGGYFDLCAYPGLAGDTTTFNDTVCVTLFALPQYDLEMVEMIAPVDGCDYSMADVVVEFKNNGDTITDGFTLGYFHNLMGTAVTETYSDTIYPGEIVTYTFTTQVNLAVTVDTEFDFSVFVSYNSDPLQQNDTISMMVESFMSPADPVVNGATIFANQSITLDVVNPNLNLWYNWYTSDTTQLWSGPSYTTPNLFDTTMYYVEASTGSNQSIVVGTGTTVSTYIPVYGWFDYSWSSAIYKQNEIGVPMEITSVWYYVNNAVSYQMLNQKMFMRNTSTASFTTSIYPTWSAYTQVFNGNITWVGPGWQEIVLTDPFVYDGLSNLEIAWQNYDGSYTSGYPNFLATTVTGGSIYAYSDGSFPAYAGSIYTARANVRLDGIQPGCESALVPVTVNVQYAAYDGQVVDILSPITGSYLTTPSVTAILYNNGLNPISNFQASYTVNGGNLVTQTVTDTIQPGDSLTFTFTQPAALTIFGVYDICVSVNVPNDGFAGNNTVCEEVENMNGDGLTCATAFPYGFVNDPAESTATLYAYDFDWWSFQVDHPMENVSISLCGSAFDTQLSYWLSCADANYTAYNDDYCGSGQSQIDLNTGYLAPGTYYVRVYGWSSGFGAYTLNITGTYADKFTINLTGNNVACNGDATGSIQTTLSAGPTGTSASLPVTYSWAPTSQTTANISGLIAGTYTVTVTDATGWSQTETIVITESAPIAITGVTVDNTVIGGNAGSVDATVTGGNTPYSYYWGNSATTQDINNAYAGIYNLTVTDALACAETATFPVHSPSPFTVTPTSIQHLIVIPQNALITLDGAAVAPGSFVAVFYDSAGVQKCGGWAYWSGMATTLIAYGQTAGQDNGFAPNETFSWRVYNSLNGANYGGTATYNIPMYPHNSTFQIGGLSGITKVEAFSIITQTINLPEGWSIWSTYINPTNPNIASVLAAIAPVNNPASQVIICKNDAGSIFWPLYNLNLIGNVVIGKGYQIKIGTPGLTGTSFGVTGLKLDATTPFTISAGWSLIAYLKTTPASAVTMLASIAPVQNPTSCVEIVKNGAGNIFWPIYNLNTIGNMIPGQGYQLKNKCAALTFSYPAGGSKAEGTTYSEPKHFRGVENTGNNMTLGIDVNAWKLEPMIGDEIGVFDASGKLIGSSVYEGGFTAVTIWGKETIDPAEKGSDGSKYSVRFWQSATDLEMELVINAWEQGSDAYVTDGIAVASKVTIAGGFDDTFVLSQNMPNPFNSSTIIPFYVPVDCFVNLAIYNSLGQKITDIYNENVSAGKYEVTFDAANLPAGNYYYKLVSDQFVGVKTMTIE